MLQSKTKGDALFLVMGILLGKLLPGDLSGIHEFATDPAKRPWLVNCSIIVLVAVSILYLYSREDQPLNRL